MTLAVAILLTATAPGWAQRNDPSVKPDNIVMLETKPPIAEYVMAGLSLVAALAVGFMPSKRAND